MFEEKSKPAISSRPLGNIKSIDRTMFLPCRVILEQQTKRAWFIAHLCKTTVVTYSAINYTPIDFGWELDENNEWFVKWFEGYQVPRQLKLTDTDNDIEQSEDEIDWDSDKYNELSSDDENESL